MNYYVHVLYLKTYTIAFLTYIDDFDLPYLEPEQQNHSYKKVQNAVGYLRVLSTTFAKFFLFFGHLFDDHSIVKDLKKVNIKNCKT